MVSRRTWLDLTNQNGGLPTSLMVNAPPNLNSLKDYRLQNINNGDNRRLSINSTESIKQGETQQKGRSGVGGVGVGGGYEH